MSARRTANQSFGEKLTGGGSVWAPKYTHDNNNYCLDYAPVHVLLGQVCHLAKLPDICLSLGPSSGYPAQGKFISGTFVLRLHLERRCSRAFHLA